MAVQERGAGPSSDEIQVAVAAQGQEELFAGWGCFVSALVLGFGTLISLLYVPIILFG